MTGMRMVDRPGAGNAAGPAGATRRRLWTSGPAIPLGSTDRAGADRWRRENAEAIASFNAWLETNGLPLDRYRQF